MAVDPVVTPAVTNAAANTVSNTAGAVAKEGSGFFGSIFSHLFGTPWGMIKGVFSNTFGNIFGTLLTGGIFAGLVKVAPDFVNWLPFKIGGKKVAQAVVDDENKSGDRGLIMDSLIAGVAINGTWGAIKGGMNQVSSSGEEPTTGGKIGGFLTSAAIVTAIGAVAISALNKSGTGVDFTMNKDLTSDNPPSGLPTKSSNSRSIP